MFAELQSDLDRIWKAPAVKAPEGLWGMIRSRVLSLGLVVSIGFLLLVSLVASAALAAFGEWWGSIFGEFEWLFHVLDFVVSIAVIAVMFALMYKILPRVSIAWHDVWIGAGVTALLFAIGKFSVGLYVGKTSVASSFGTAGSLAVLLVWVYYSAQIFLLGAEFTWVYAHRFGSRKGQDKPATAKEGVATTDKPGGGAPPAATGQRARRPMHGERPAAVHGVAGLMSRHTAALTAGAIVLGALAGSLLRPRRPPLGVAHHAVEHVEEPAGVHRLDQVLVESRGERPLAVVRGAVAGERQQVRRARHPRAPPPRARSRPCRGGRCRESQRPARTTRSPPAPARPSAAVSTT